MPGTAAVDVSSKERQHKVDCQDVYKMFLGSPIRSQTQDIRWVIVKEKGLWLSQRLSAKIASSLAQP